MNLLQAILNSQLTYRIGWTLIHSLWQGALIAAALEMAVVCLRGKSPQSRYLAACLAMACQFVLLVGTFLLLSGPPIRLPSTDSVQTPALAVPVVSVAPITNRQIAPAIAEPPRTKTHPEENSWQRFLQPLDTAIPWIGCMWCCGFLVLSFWNLGGLIAVHRLKTLTTRSVDQALDCTLARLLTRLQIGRRVRLLQSALVESPIVVGVIKPVIVFPTRLMTQLSPEQIEAILIHELAHIYRHDYLVNLFQVAIDTLLFYHPATWWISLRIRAERENCCDDIVITTTVEREVYVTALAVIAESRMALAPAASGAPLLPRIRRLLGVPDHRRPYSFVSLILSAIPLVIGIFFCSEQLVAQVSQSDVKTRTVIVWKVDPIDSHPSVVPDELMARAAQHNIRLKITILSKKEFAEAYAKAKTNGTEPDIICSFDGTDESTLKSRGQCIVQESLNALCPYGAEISIFSSSPNFLAAKELALAYPITGGNEDTLKELDPALEKSVLDFAEAHSVGDVPTTMQLLDPSVLKDFQGSEFGLVHALFPHGVVLKKKICSAWVGEHIAIVQTMAFSESPNYITYDGLTTIFEGKRGDWKLVDYINRCDLADDLIKQIGKLSGKHPAQTQDPVLVGPAEGSCFPGGLQDSRPPNFEWKHVDENVEAYFAETQVNAGAWCTFPIKTVIRPTSKDQILASQGPPNGAPQHRWRLWAIYGDGSVSLSDWRAFYYNESEPPESRKTSPGVPQSSSVPTLQQQYLDANTAWNKGMDFRGKGDYMGEIKAMEEAYADMLKIRATDPSWEQALVGHRMSEWQSELEKLPKEFQARMPH